VDNLAPTIAAIDLEHVLFSALRLAHLLLAGLVVAVTVITWATIRMLRRPARRTFAWAMARGVPADPSELDQPRAFDTITVRSAGLDLAAWSIAGDDPNGPAVISTPGWGDSRINALPRLEALAPHARRVIAWDPPGQGESGGNCGLGITEPTHLDTILDTLIDDDTPVVLHGWSLGGGVSIHAAAMRLDAGRASPRIVGVIAECPYRLPTTPARNVVRASHLPWTPTGPLAYRLLAMTLAGRPPWRADWPGFDRAEHARTLARHKTPLLVVHGERDPVSPFEDGRAIAEAAGAFGALATVPDGRHNSLWREPRERGVCVDAVSGFLKRLAGRPLSQPG
jgi:pimeloyl-ACP methyl ester carboxylesterase